MMIAALAAVFAAQAVAEAENPVVPFLAVTGRPTEADIARKVAALKADGFEEFLIYARSGLQLRYMGEEWLDVVDLLCREADRRGMKVWLYDEYNWPSGTCRGRVPNEDERYRYAEWAVYREQDGSYRWQKVLAPKGWVNVLDEGAMKRFVELTHEVYEKRLAKWFAKKLIKGIFTDEPGHPTAIHFEGNPLRHFACWDGLEAAYAARTGGDFRRDVEANLSGKGPATVWEVYSQLQGERFRANYFDRIEKWCAKMGIVSTGHMIAEHELRGSCRYNGSPLLALKGESLPGMDEINTRAGDNAEWLTLGVAQHAATRNGRGGLVELYALGPNDMSATRLRQMIWLEAMFGVDHYLTCMEVMDQRGLVEKHGYLSPIQEGQPWHRHLRLLIDDAKYAAAFARRLDYTKTAAVRYPQKAAARALHANENAPDLRGFLGAVSLRQMTFDLIEEDEKTELPYVFAFEGETLRETNTGTAFKSPSEAADWLVARTKQSVRYYKADGSLAEKLLVRTYADGSSVALDLRNTGERRLFVEIGGERRPCALPSRGVFALGPGEFPPEPADAAKKGFTVAAKEFAYRLDRDNVIRLGFDPDNLARFTVSEPLTDVRFVLRDFTLTYAVTGSGRPVDFEDAAPGEKIIRHDAVPYTFELDGRPLKGENWDRSLPVEFRGLYRETAPLALAAGEHTLRIVTGESDRNFFLPVAFLSGAIARKGCGIGRLPARLRFGSLAEQGLGDYCGEVTYHLEGVEPKSDTLHLSTGGLFTRVHWNGTDLGVRAWEPFDWHLPSGGPGELDVTVYTSVVRIFGDVDRPGADWDTHFWIKPSESASATGLMEN